MIQTRQDKAMRRLLLILLVLFVVVLGMVGNRIWATDETDDAGKTDAPTESMGAGG